MTEADRLENDFISPVNDVDINIQYIWMNSWNHLVELLTLHRAWWYLDDFGYLHLSQRWNVAGMSPLAIDGILDHRPWVQIFSGSVGQVVYLDSQKPISPMALFPVNTGNSKARWVYISLLAQCSWTAAFISKICPAWHKDTEGNIMVIAHEKFRENNVPLR